MGKFLAIGWIFVALLWCGAGSCALLAGVSAGIDGNAIASVGLAILGVLMLACMVASIVLSLEIRKI